MYILCIFSIILIVSAASFTEALHLPKYIKACNMNDPNFNDCALKHAQNAIPSIVKGDRQYRIPNMEPLIIPEVDIDSGGSLDMHFSNVKLSGLDTAIVKNIDMNIKKQQATITLHVPEVKMLSDYVIKGRILILPIEGNGLANFTFVDGDYVFSFNWTVVKHNDGVEYGNITSYKVELETKRDYFHLENLFNGNKLLGDEMNKFLDENWKDVHAELHPAVSEVVGQIANTIAKSIYEHVPYNEIFIQ